MSHRERHGGDESGQWSSGVYEASDRTDAWEAELARNYRAWQLAGPLDDDWDAHLRYRQIGDLRVVDLSCDPCAGGRLARHVEHEEEHLGLHLVTSGSERFELDGRSVVGDVHNIVVWTTERPATFTIDARVGALSVIVPLAPLRERLPGFDLLGGGSLDSRRGMGAVLRSHVETVARNMDAFRPDDSAAIRRSILELMIAAMSERTDAASPGPARSYLKRLQDYILANLQDDSLSPATIAHANRISVRYVHVLFAQTGQSVSSWIRTQRLQRCREALVSPRFRDTSVAEIAYRWGFGDPTYFSRAFKQHYGVNPSQLRQDRSVT